MLALANSGNCGDYTDYVFTVTGGNSNIFDIFTFPSSPSGDFNLDLYTEDVSYASGGPYTFTVSRSLSEYQAYSGYTHTLTFDLNVIDPCPTAVYTQPPISPDAYDYQIWDATLSIAFSAFSSDIPNAICGDFVYEAQDASGN